MCVCVRALNMILTNNGLLALLVIFSGRNVKHRRAELCAFACTQQKSVVAVCVYPMYCERVVGQSSDLFGMNDVKIDKEERIDRLP